MFNVVSSLKNIINLNPINRIYQKYTGFGTFVPIDGGSTADGDFISILASFGDSGISFIIILKPDKSIGETQTFTYDGETIEGSVEDTGMTVTAEMLPMFEETYHIILDESWLGSPVYMCSAMGLGDMAGNHVFEFVGGDVDWSYRYSVPVKYFIKEVSNAGGNVYYVAFRNTEDYDDSTGDWSYVNGYTNVTFYENDSQSTNVGIAEQDPGMPVTWSPQDVWDDLSDESKSSLQEYYKAVGFELYLLYPYNAATYFRANGAQSNSIWVNENMINYTTLETNKKYDLDNSSWDIVETTDVTLTDYIDISAAPNFKVTYNCSSRSWVEAMWFDANKQPVGWSKTWQEVMEIETNKYQKDYWLDSTVKYVRLQWKTSDIPNWDISLKYVSAPSVL